MSSTKNIFAIYASQDKDVLQYLLLHLQPLEQDFNLAIWSDDTINSGQPWKPRNVSRLEHADVFLLLLSTTFMHSEFVKQGEFKRIIDRYKEGNAFAIPILLDDCQWDVEFIFDDYNFNFRELQVFHKDERPIGDWNSTDEIFKQVGYFIRGLLTSSTRKNVLEAPVNKGEEKIRNTRKEEQIEIDFFGEREVNNKAEWEEKRKKEAETIKRVEEYNKLSEEAEAKEVIRKGKRLRQKAEIQKRIEKEKSLKEKAKKDKKIEEEVEAKRVVQNEMRDNEVAKAKMVIEEKGRIEIPKSHREGERGKTPGEMVASQKRVTKKNGLARYNYRFKTSKVVEAKRVVQEERRDKEEAKAKIAVEEKRRGEIIKSLRETEREKTSGEIVASQKRVAKKYGLARYNHQFKTSKLAEAKRVVQEERLGKEKAKAKKAVVEKRHGEIIKSLRETVRVKRLGEIVAALKRVIKKYGLSGNSYRFKTSKVVEDKVVQEERQGNDEAKAKKAVVEKRRGERTKFLRETVRVKRLGEIVAALKKAIKKYGLSGYSYRFKTSKVVEAKKVVQEERWGNEEAKAKKAVVEKRRGEITKFLRETVRKKRLGEIVAALKKIIKKNRVAVQNYPIKTATAINQFYKEAKKSISTNKKRRVRPEFLIAALVIFGILIFVFTGDSEKQSTTLSEIEEAGVDSDAGVITKTNPENQAAAILKLDIGDIYKDGIIFTIDPSNETGKIASMEDEGPMTWKNAMTIHEQLGEGWRLPTLDELRLIYKNIGQGADNKGDFADELYWSATPFDDYQARLLRFSDGNASYHYNSSGTFRKFRVRAIQDVKL